ncbi:MAG: hypothetical protein IJ849_05050 [Selenomonadaceae bacterium]|nr:hypothetical protein [Selenomonadaceae bacterium]
MIPKIIHYCWMSGEPFPPLIEECMATWREILPDYEIVEWNSKNFPVDSMPFTREAMACRKYAFVSDVVRLYALYHFGGIYLDSDIKVLKSFNDLLYLPAFTGFETEHDVGVWLLASEKHNPIFKEMLDCYWDKHFLEPDGSMDLTPNPLVLKHIFIKHNIMFNNQQQETEFITVFPTEYFAPMDVRTGLVNITDNSYAMHLFNGAWLEKSDWEYRALFLKNYGLFHKFLPKAIVSKVAHALTIYKQDGFMALLKKTAEKICKSLVVESSCIRGGYKYTYRVQRKKYRAWSRVYLCRRVCP